MNGLPVGLGCREMADEGMPAELGYEWQRLVRDQLSSVRGDARLKRSVDAWPDRFRRRHHRRSYHSEGKVNSVMRPSNSLPTRTRRLALITLLMGAAVLAGCGSSNSSSSSSTTAASTTAAAAAATNSSQPSYCSSLTSLETSVKAIPSTNVVKNGTNSLKSAVAQVQKDATAVVNDAKSDFAAQTSTLKSSVDTLSASVKQFSSPP